MKKVVQVFTAAVVCATLAGGVVAADTSNTGPDSYNSETTTIDNHSSSNCDNNVNVTTSNLQDAQSGNADTSGNTTGGGATSGNVNNNNNTNINLDTGCGTVTTATNPKPTGGKGGDTVAGAQAAAPVTVTGTLPETGSTTDAALAVGSVIVLGVALAASRLGLATYRRLSL
jgi:hypothetical protein